MIGADPAAEAGDWTLFEAAEHATTAEEQRRLLEGARGRLEGLLLLTQPQKLEISYVALADAAEDRGRSPPRSPERSGTSTRGWRGSSRPP